MFQQFNIHFSGEGKKTPEEALPTDADYEWIEGPKEKNSQRYFFLSNDKYFGTGIVKKNLKGWTASGGVSGIIPKQMEDNTINAALSDGELLFGMIQLKGDAKVFVNDEQANIVELTSLSDEVIEMYSVSNYSIWYVDLNTLHDSDQFFIQVVNQDGEILSEIFIN